MSRPGPSHARAALSTCSASCATCHAPTARHEPLSVWANSAAESADAARMPSTNIAHCRSNSRRTSASRFRSPKVMRARWAASIISNEARRAEAGASASLEFGGFFAASFAALVIACTSLMRCIASSFHQSRTLSEAAAGWNQEDDMKTDTFSAAYAGKAKKPLRRPIPPHTGRNVSQKIGRGRPNNVAAAALRCSNEHALTMIKDTLTSRFFCSAKRIG